LKLFFFGITISHFVFPFILQDVCPLNDSVVEPEAQKPEESTLCGKEDNAEDIGGDNKV
jgi:hypothetical protein